MIAKVLIDIAHTDVDQLYDYKVPAHLDTLIVPGHRVEVRFNRALRSGTVMKLQKTSQRKDLEEIVDLLEEHPMLNDRQRAMAAALHVTYATPLQHYHHLMTPRGMTVKRRVYVKQTVPNDAFDAFFKTRDRLSLTTFKAHAKALKEGLKQGLLHLETVLTEQVQRPQETRLSIRQDSPVRGVKQEALLTLLRAYPEGLEKQLACALSGASNATVKRLEALGILATHTQPLTLSAPTTPHQALSLSPSQETTVTQALQALKDQRDVLLHGDAHAGKVELYLALIQAITQAGGRVLFLVPDAWLIKPYLRRLQTMLNVPIATLYSKQSDGEQRLHWHAIQEGQARVILGTRMAIFAPFEHVDAILMDEAHAQTYRAEHTPQFDTFDLTRWLAHHAQIPVVYGSATPPLALWKAQREKSLTYLPLTPEASLHIHRHVIDMRDVLRQQHTHPLSPDVLQAIGGALERNEKVLILKNRKGYASALHCRSCGYIPRCETCGLSLFYHQDPDQLRCHHCHTHEPYHETCPHCQADTLKPLGTGTQQLLERVQQTFPNAKTLRLDQDALKTKQDHRRIEQSLDAADLIVGTQMLVQGFAFEHVSVMVVVDADELLEAPHFDASHETLVLLRQLTAHRQTQAKDTTVFVQTYQPHHPVFKAWQDTQEEDYVQEILNTREKLKLPPFYDLTQLIISHANEDTAYHKAMHLKLYLQKALRDHVAILGPTRHSVYRQKGQYRYQLTLKAPTLEPHRENIARAVKAFAPTVSLIPLR